MDQGRRPSGRKQGGQRGIAPEPDHHGGVQPGEGAAGLHDSGGDAGEAAGHADRVAGLEGRRLERQPLLGGEVGGVLRPAGVGGQHDAPAAVGQRPRQRLGGEQVPAGAPRGDHG